MNATAEKFTNEAFALNLKSIKDMMVPREFQLRNQRNPDDPNGPSITTVVTRNVPIVRCVVELPKGSWFKTYDQKLGAVIDQEVVTMIIDVEYSGPKEAHKRCGFSGWVATAGEIEVTDTLSGEKTYLSGMTSQINRALGCLNAQIEGASKELLAVLGVKSYINSCSGEIRTFNIPEEYADEFMAVVENIPHWKLNKAPEMIRGNMRYEFQIEPCEHLLNGSCKEYRREAKYPRIHIPYPGQEDIAQAGTGMTRYLMSAVAGFVAKLKDPSFPGKPGVRKFQGKDNPYVYSNELFPNCQTCAMCKYVRRSNDPDEGEMGQSSIAATKTDGIDPVYGCRKTGDWIMAIYQAMVDLNGQEIPFGSDLGASIIRKAGEAAACECYTWRDRLNSSKDAKRAYPQQSVWHEWVPATKCVEFIDDQYEGEGEERKLVTPARIESKVPFITVGRNIPAAHVEIQRKFQIVLPEVPDEKKHLPKNQMPAETPVVVAAAVAEAGAAEEVPAQS